MAKTRDAAPASAVQVVFALLFSLCLAANAPGQSASARKDFVNHLGQSTVVTRKGSQLIPAYKISTAGPDSSYFVYHAQLMNPSICRSLLTERLVSRFLAMGFTKLICTDDAEASFTFDPVLQTVSPVDSRKDYVEMVRRSVMKQMGARAPAGYRLSAEGPEGTSYVHHQSAVSLADCNQLLDDRFISGLRGYGFTRVICTDDRTMTFAFDLNSQSSASAFALLEKP
ncbi:MAG TPA: hypothetical protein VMI10_07810 [Terriglobales bacterium]|nr:hypothetical protein [Terriglobales bacterium]